MEHEPEGIPPFQTEVSLNGPVLGSPEEDDRETTLPTSPKPGGDPGLFGRLQPPGF